VSSCAQSQDDRRSVVTFAPSSQRAAWHAASQIATQGFPMLTFALVLVALMALLHVYILVLEMFLWTTKRGRKAFGTTSEFAEASKVLAANQGLYNGFLAAGLGWALTTGGWEGYKIAMFFRYLRWPDCQPPHPVHPGAPGARDDAGPQRGRAGAGWRRRRSRGPLTDSRFPHKLTSHKDLRI
jgi:uncharacterized membrane protein